MKKSTIKMGLALGIGLAAGFIAVRLIGGHPFDLKLIISALAGGLAGGLAGAYVIALMAKKKQAG